VAGVPSNGTRPEEKTMKCVESLQATIKATRQAGELAAKAIQTYSGQCSGQHDDPRVLLPRGGSR